jgi:hypothetical protein
MTRIFMLLASAAAIVSLGVARTASAETVCTDLGCVTVNEGGYAIVIDGAASNPDPLDGFISVGSGQVCADDNGTADDGDPSNGPESESPTCAP